MEIFLRREIRGIFHRRLKIMSVFDQLRTESAHGSVLLHAVAMRYNDHTAQAFASCRKCDALAMVATSRSDNTLCVWIFADKFLHIHNPSAHFECAHRIVVLVFHPDLRSNAFA